MRVYKVVRHLADGRFVSALVPARKGRLEYRIGETTVPQFGGVFAFSDLYYVHQFRQGFGLGQCWIVLAGEGGPAMLLPHMCNSHDPIRAKRQAWANVARIMTNAWPTGTVVVESFTPTEVVQ